MRTKFTQVHCTWVNFVVNLKFASKVFEDGSCSELNLASMFQGQRKKKGKGKGNRKRKRKRRGKARH